MKVRIFAEEAGTTREETDIPFQEYYQGGFLAISGLAKQLETYGEVEIQILTDRFGLVNGEERVNEYEPETPPDSDGRIETALDSLLMSSQSSDVVIVLLSTSTFDSLVVDNWNAIVNNAAEDTIWCFGAARSSLDGLDFTPLEEKGCEIVTYERVGVARISNDVREELLETVEETMTDQH